ncbi:hypothetical protein ABVT39_011068 [Epinephelus coioides]
MTKERADRPHLSADSRPFNPLATNTHTEIGGQNTARIHAARSEKGAPASVRINAFIAEICFSTVRPSVCLRTTGRTLDLLIDVKRLNAASDQPVPPAAPKILRTDFDNNDDLWRKLPPAANYANYANDANRTRLSRLLKDNVTSSTKLISSLHLSIFHVSVMNVISTRTQSRAAVRVRAVNIAAACRSEQSGVMRRPEQTRST